MPATASMVVQRPTMDLSRARKDHSTDQRDDRSQESHPMAAAPELDVGFETCQFPGVAPSEPIFDHRDDPICSTGNDGPPSRRGLRAEAAALRRPQVNVRSGDVLGRLPECDRKSWPRRHPSAASRHDRFHRDQVGTKWVGCHSASVSADHGRGACLPQPLRGPES